MKYQGDKNPEEKFEKIREILRKSPERKSKMRSLISSSVGRIAVKVTISVLFLVITGAIFSSNSDERSFSKVASYYVLGTVTTLGSMWIAREL